MLQFVRNMRHAIVRAVSKHPTPQDAASVVKSSAVATATTCVNAVIFVLSALPKAPSLFLFFWLFATVALSVRLAVLSRRAAKRQITHVSRRGARRLIETSVLLALPWAVLNIYVLGMHGAGEPLVLISVTAGMIAGGALILQRVCVATVWFIGTILASVVLGFHLGGWPQAWTISAYSIVYGVSLAYFSNLAGETAREKDRSVDALSDAVKNLRRARDENYILANVDDTTGLLNRKAFRKAIAEKANALGAEGNGFSLLMIDLDRFKHINDLFGHGVGDELLSVFAKRIRGALKSDDILGRLGGDEFSVILDGVQSEEQIGRIAHSLLEVLSKPALLSGRVVHSGGSIGVVICPRDGVDPAELLVLADLALSKAKDDARGRCVIYNDQIRDKVVSSNAVEADLRAALANDRILIEYQPKICMKDNLIAGAEALVRIKTADGRKLPPDLFLPIAAERGLLPNLSRRIAETVAADITAWKSAGARPGKIALNVHPFDIKTPEHLMALIDMFETRSITSDDLIIEVTEGCFIGRGTDRATFVLDALADRGYELSLDDFGTGHASLSHLKTIPVSELKIDRSFITGIENRKDDLAIVTAITEIARGMGIRSVAEGIENEGQQSLVRKLDVDMGQGYFWSRALEASEFEALLSTPLKKTGT
ncbi:MAG: EAL domain-containing protein [Litoreibacter sp.]|nr:EAL domain-containing protein [Litoreibacter sp.]